MDPFAEQPKFGVVVRYTNKTRGLTRV